MRVKVYVGTSGWMYDWNKEGSLDWYIENTELNAIELNASFYRFPFPNQVRSWAKKSRGILRWSIKVHRSITHTRKLREEAISIWRKFKRLFKPLDKYTDFYLLQLPPSYRFTREYMSRIKMFAEESKLGERLAVEFRDKSWFESREAIRTLEDLGVTMVSIDSPLGRYILETNGIVYLRMHGRTEWYLYEYSREELKEISNEIMKLKPEKVYVFFNNNHWMLENAHEMFYLLRDLVYKKLYQREEKSSTPK